MSPSLTQASLRRLEDSETECGGAAGVVESHLLPLCDAQDADVFVCFFGS